MPAVLIVYTTVNNYDITISIHFLCSTAKIQIVSRIFTRFTLISESSSAYSVIVHFLQMILLFHNIIVSVMRSVDNAMSFRNTIAQKIDYFTFYFS